MSSAQSVLQRELSETNSAAVQTARNTSGRTVRRVVNKPAATLPDLLQPRSDCVCLLMCVCVLHVCKAAVPRQCGSFVYSHIELIETEALPSR